MAITDGPMVLPADLVLAPVAELPVDLREHVQAEGGDWVVTRPRSRAPSQIVDSQAAQLLREFQRPKRIVEAIIHFSRAVKADPNETLDAAYPLLQRLVSARFLVEIDSKDASKVQPSLEAGERFAECEVLRCVQALEDVELYQVRTSEGETAALKIARPGAGPAVALMLRREAAILGGLDGRVSPKLLLGETTAGRPYLLLEWCPGIDASVAAAELRRAAEPGARLKLLQLCRAIAEAYACLHGQHVLHGDIHPRNILVSGDDEIKIIDYGLARLSGVESEWRNAPRGGVPFYFEPEYAEAARAGQNPPPTTAAGEQYGVAALLYSLLTGAYYRDFSLEKAEMLRQIAEDGPLPFARQRAAVWPEVELLLEKALQKKATERFASVAEFAAALGRAGTLKAPSGTASAMEPPVPGAASELLEKMIEQLRPSGALYLSGVREAPTASVNFGAAGIGYALYRIACARGDAALLSLADLWVQRAARDAGSSRAFWNYGLEIEPKTVGRISPYHTASGIRCVQALIARARDDAAAAQTAIGEYVKDSRAFSCDSLDVTLGRSGTVVAGALLLEALAGMQWVDVEPVVRLGNEVLGGVWEQIETYGPIRECREIEYTSAAHGWAGLLFAAMRWHQATGAPVMPGVARRLQELADYAEPAGEGLRWRWGTVSHPEDGMSDYMAGWCNGSAGQVFTWTLAHQLFPEAGYLEIAEKAAWNAWEYREKDNASLCCGLPGQAYALLSLYRQNGQAVWMERARELADRAAMGWQTSRETTAFERSAARPESLYKGELGVAVLAADLVHPEYAAMPLYESENWPR